MTPKFPDEVLLARAMYYMYNTRERRTPMWVDVAKQFSLSYAQAEKLCARFGYDPDQYYWQHDEVRALNTANKKIPHKIRKVRDAVHSY